MNTFDYKNKKYCYSRKKYNKFTLKKALSVKELSAFFYEILGK